MVQIKERKINNIQKLNNSLAELKRGKFYHYYLVCGDEQYLVGYLSEQVISAIKKQAKIKDVEVLFGNYESLSESGNIGFESLLQSLSNIGTLFDTKEKITWIKMSGHIFNPSLLVKSTTGKNREKRQKWVKKMQKYADTLSNILEKSDKRNDYVVFTAYDKPSNNKLMMQVQNKGKVIDFNAFKEYEIKVMYEFISKRILEPRKKYIDMETFKLLVEYAGLSLQRIVNDLETLILYIGDKKEICQQDIKNMLGVTRDMIIYELQDSFGDRDHNRYIQILDSLTQQGTGYPQIISKLYERISFLRQAKKIVSLERIDVSRLLQLHYFKINEYLKKLKTEHKNRLGIANDKDNLLTKNIKFIEKILKQSENFTNQELDRTTNRLLQIDLKVKTSKIDGPMQLQMLLQQI